MVQVLEPTTPENEPEEQLTGADIPEALQKNPIGHVILALRPAMAQNVPARQATGADSPVEPQ